MKKLLFISALAIIFSCKKSNNSPTPTQTNPMPTVQQDPALIGIWVLDSTKYDGQPCYPFNPTHIAGYGDTIFISIQKYEEHLWSTMLVGFSTKWHTQNDSLYALGNSKYSVGNNILWQYLNSAAKCQHWYHKK